MGPDMGETGEGRAAVPGSGAAVSQPAAWGAGPLRAGPEGTTIRVRVVPGARRTELAGVAGGVLRLRVAAPPVDGKANQAVLELLAGRLGVRPRALRLTAGERSREKTVVAHGVAVADAAARLGVASS